MVAGYRTSGESQRPGFAWFFWKRAFWSTLALNSEGDFETARTGAGVRGRNFSGRTEKFPHEIAHGREFCELVQGLSVWIRVGGCDRRFLLLAMGDYVKASGDVEFAKANWDHLRRAYSVLRTRRTRMGFRRILALGMAGRRRTALAGEIGVLPERTGGGSAKRFGGIWRSSWGRMMLRKTLSEQSEKRIGRR